MNYILLFEIYIHKSEILMKILKKYFGFLIILVFLLWSDTPIFATSEQLMLFEDVKVSQKFIKYHEEKWEQKSRLQEPTPFNRHPLRFVSSPSTLPVGYGVLPDSGIEIPNLALPEYIYENLRKIGTFVKVFLGYLKNSDFGTNASFTPEGTNVLIPYVSSIVQWKADTPPELVPCGFFRKEQTSPIIVLLSGNQGKDYQESISNFYNHIYRESIEDDTIEVLSADNIADMYIPYLLKGMIEAGKAEPFTMKFCAEEVIENKLRKIFCYIKDPEDKAQKAQNIIYCTLELLKFLIQGQDCMTRHDTVSRLCDNYLEEITDEVPSKEKEADFKKFIKKHKNDLMKAAFNRMDDEINKIDLLKVEFNKWKKYLEYCLFPSSNLDTIEKAQSFWLFIHCLGEELQCSNPDGGRTINVVKRLYKVCFPASNNENHTERLLIGLLRTKPQSILGNLKELFDRKKSDKKPLVAEVGFPKYLGFMVDSFSWLDVCKSCADFLHTNSVWSSTLQNLRPIIEEYDFVIPSEKIDSLFRFISQDQYPTTSNYYCSVPPLDLTDAGGGSVYRRSGWDFRFLSEERVCLATRYNIRQTLIRDKVIEGIQNKLIELISTYKPLSFYTSAWLWPILDMERPFCINALFLLQAYYPENKALRINLSQKIFANPRRYHLLRPVLETTNESIKQEEYASIFLRENIKYFPHEYARVYFGTGCIEKIKMFSTKSVSNIKNYIIDFSKYCRVYESQGIIRQITTDDLTLKEAIENIINHWKNKWRKGKKTSGYDFSNYETNDKDITISMVTILQGLSNLEQDIDISSDEKQELCDALNQLNI
jgi:hypothetical protein